MKSSTLISLVAVLVAAFIGFYVGKSTITEAAAISPAPVETTNAKEESSGGEAAAPVVPVPESEPTPAQTPTAPVTPLSTPDIAPVTSTHSPDGIIHPAYDIGISDDKVSRVLTSVSKNMEALNLSYASSKLQDCSGIYHQLKDSIQSRFPRLRKKRGFMYPKVKKDRSSRQIADWYHEQDNLLIIEDPVASRNSIRPGSVMFFGQSGKIFRDLTIDRLTDRKNNYTKNGAIQHIAVVTSVRTDAEGNVVSYEMMHARYPGGPPASMSGSKAVQSNSGKNKAKVAPYPFGHWTQQWVAVANIMTPAAR